MAKKVLTKCSTCRREQQVNWREEYIALLKKVYPRRWQEELFKAGLRASARTHNYAPRKTYITKG